MTQSWSGWHWSFGLVGSLATSGVIAAPTTRALAQIVPDSTLSTNNSSVTPEGNSVVVTGGAKAGNNLFHSFQEFSIPPGVTAYFNNALNIQNVFSRVTGSSISNIDGQIRANGTANLFLINPNGIIFGPNASLNIGGSFVGSTASGLNFADGTQFSATTPKISPLLTVSIPIGLQFGANPASILNQSKRTDRNSNFSSGLEPRVGSTIALVGGDLEVDGGSLSLVGGRVELGGLAGAGVVGLNVNGNALRLNFPDSVALADILLTDGATINVTSGDTQILGKRIALTNNSVIQVNNRESKPGGILNLTASESVELSGRSRLFTGMFGVGNGGNLTITTQRLIVKDGAGVSTATFEQGQGGDLMVTAADSVELIGSSVDRLFPSGSFTGSFGSGNAGNLTIATGRLIVRDGAQVSASARNIGRGGALTVAASDSIELSGTTPDGRSSSGLFTTATNLGSGGNLKIKTGLLNISNKAEVSVSSQGAGDAGNLQVVANSIFLDNQSALTAESVSGSGGNIVLQAQDLMVLQGSSSISAISGTQDRGGSAGSIKIDAKVFLASENSDIIANSFGGLGANALIDASVFFLSPNSEIVVNGEEIEIEPLDLDANLDVSPPEVVSVEGLIVQGCSKNVGSAASKFVFTGHGGLPPNPREALASDQPLADLGTPIQDQGDRAQAIPSTNFNTETPPTQLVEAQGWMIDANGEVALTTQPVNATPYQSWLTAANCHTPQTTS